LFEEETNIRVKKTRTNTVKSKVKLTTKENF